jgi:alginate O-acetyltransferase complex protein AlgI
VIFLTYWFWAFAAAFFPLYALARPPLLRKALLLVACAVFHTHFAGPAGVLPIIGLGVLTYAAARTRHRLACLVAIGLCVLALAFYKYTTFILGRVVDAAWPDLGRALAAAVGPLRPAAPPLAISFFVFEFVHYLVDVRRGDRPIASPLDFALFAIFWPSIVSGPIKRYQQFLPALAQGLGHVRADDLAQGMLRLAAGLVKKLAADGLSAYLEATQPQFGALTLLGRWGFVAGLGARILLDFSGYSDLAIGFARMCGITLPENFDWPYLARNVAEFWQRWHMSLSLWIRDYVYIPLGGGRHGVARRVLNGLVAFAACGLWHGPDWNFVVWGLYHGAGLAVCTTYASLPGVAGRAARGLFDLPGVAWLATLLFVGLGWVLFFYPLAEAVRMLGLLVPRP